MRKLLLSALCLLFMTGVVLAADVIFVKYDDNKLTVKDGGVEKTYTVNDSTKVLFVDKDGNTKAGKLKVLEKMKKGRKMTITTDKDVVTEIKLKGGKKKQN